MDRLSVQRGHPGPVGPGKPFAFSRSLNQSVRVTKPLALMAHERVLPGGQLVNRLQDMGYRVATTHLASLAEFCSAEKPLLVIVDLMPPESAGVSVIQRLRSNPETNHLPVIAYAPEQESELIESAREAGATLVVTDTAITAHLDRFLQQALQLD